MKPHIYIASRSDTTVTRICGTLADQFSLNVCQNPEAFWEKIPDQAVVLLDHDFTDAKGLDFLKELMLKLPLPVLLLASADDQENVEEAMSLGAHSFIIKTGDYLKLLGFAINDASRRFHDIELLQQTIQEQRNRLQHMETTLAAYAAADSKNVKTGDADSTKVDNKVTDIKKVPVKSAATNDSTDKDASGNNMLLEVVEKLRSGKFILPVIPGTKPKYHELVRNGIRIVELTKLLEKDPAISSKLISAASSSVYTGLVPIRTLESAIERIGIKETLNCVDLLLNQSQYMVKSHKYQPLLEEQWKHALATAYTSQELAKSLDLKHHAELFTMGLLHNIGKLLLTQIFATIENRPDNERRIPLQNFKGLMEKNHGRFGESLIKRWRLADCFAQSARYTDEIARIKNPSRDLLLVALAIRMTNELGYGKTETDAATAAVMQDFIARNSLSPDILDQIKADVTSKMSDFSTEAVAA